MPWQRLADLNIAIIEAFRSALGIGTPMVRASEIGVEGRGSELLLEICERMSATTYLSGPTRRHSPESPDRPDARHGVDETRREPSAGNPKAPSRLRSKITTGSAAAFAAGYRCRARATARSRALSSTL